jgi:hypothetical protein
VPRKITEQTDRQKRKKKREREKERKTIYIGKMALERASETDRQTDGAASEKRR